MFSLFDSLSSFKTKFFYLAIRPFSPPRNQHNIALSLIFPQQLLQGLFFLSCPGSYSEIHAALSCHVSARFFELLLNLSLLLTSLRVLKNAFISFYQVPSTCVHLIFSNNQPQAELSCGKSHKQCRALLSVSHLEACDVSLSHYL